MPAKSKARCQKPANLKSTPGKCTTTQIRKCHGRPAKHPCTAPR